MTVGEIKNLCPTAETYELRRYCHYVLILPYDVPHGTVERLNERLAADGITAEVIRRTGPNEDDHK